jgi:2-isopropylmalate synthase
MKSRKVEIYDTTLRDGTQGEDFSLSVEDKLRVAQQLDELGIPYIEGGWPGASPRDTRFFKEVKGLPLERSKIVAFGATRKADNRVEEDGNLKALLQAGTEVVTLVGKSWDIHVTKVLGTTLKKNLEMISDSVSYLKSKKKTVFLDAEHFFDGFKENPEYAVQTLQAAWKAGADCVILCDTNGGTLPLEIEEILQKTKREFSGAFGIHAHNDSDLAVANSLAAVAMGAVQVQGTINGMGERCGNANLCSIIANLNLKMGIECISPDQLSRLRDVSHFVSETANIPPNRHQPYVGESAFSHKAGLHVHAVKKKAALYEHVAPESVGNRQRLLLSDHAGRSTILHKLEEFGISIKADHPKLQEILNLLKEREDEGYQYEGAEGSFELLVKKSLGIHKSFFDLIGYRVIVERRQENENPVSEATIQVAVGNDVEHTAAEGHGPVNALDHALRKALDKFYPSLRDVRLVDYKVRVLTGRSGTASRVRVLIESADKTREWGTVAVSENIIQASWHALVDSIEYKLLKDEEEDLLPS